MPNVSPKGVFGRHAGVWKPPAAIYARSAATWKKVTHVYCYRNGAWQLIYASDPVAPATATAAWLAPHSVKITWTPPAVNSNSSWIVRRSDNSIVATVPVGTLTVTDLTPLLTSTATGNKTLAAYTVEGTDGTTSSAKASTNTVTWNLDPATQTNVVTYPNATTSAVKVSWTPNATYGEPDGWKVWEATAGWINTTPLAGSVRSFDVTAQGRGVQQNYRAVPFSKNAAGTWVQAGNDTNTVANLKATTPVSLSLTATSSPLSNLRLTWASGGGTVTAYEVETSTNGTTWAASADDVSPSDWTTSVAGYMRVRATSPGGVSDWAQAGPKTPILDTTGPAPSNITSFKPESSYGRMVVRGTWSASSDAKSGQIFYKIGSGSYVSVWGPSPITPSGVFGVVTNTASAGQVITVLVRAWDAAGNLNTADDTAVYTLAASPQIVNPTDSATWRVDEWRTDGVAGSTGVMHGRTSSGENIGCWFYGEAIQDFVSTHEVVSATLDYCRDGSSQGSSAAIQPQVWVHNHATEPAGAPTRVTSASVLGSGVARSGTTGGSATLTAAMLDLLAVAGKGLCVYRSTSDTNPDSAGSFYMRLFPFNTNSGGKVSGRVTLNHLG